MFRRQFWLFCWFTVCFDCFDFCLFRLDTPKHTQTSVAPLVHVSRWSKKKTKQNIRKHVRVLFLLLLLRFHILPLYHISGYYNRTVISMSFGLFGVFFEQFYHRKTQHVFFLFPFLLRFYILPLCLMLNYDPMVTQVSFRLMRVFFAQKIKNIIVCCFFQFSDRLRFCILPLRLMTG